AAAPSPCPASTAAWPTRSRCSPCSTSRSSCAWARPTSAAGPTTSSPTSPTRTRSASTTSPPTTCRCPTRRTPTTCSSASRTVPSRWSCGPDPARSSGARSRTRAGGRASRTAQDLPEVVPHRLLQLRVGAAARGAVRAPAAEPGRVPEPLTVLHVVVGHLGHQFRPQRHPGQVLLARPAARRPRQPGRLVRRLLRPGRPRMPRHVVHPQRRQLLDQLRPALHRERRRHPHVLQDALVVVQPEQQRPHHRPALVQAVARHHHVRRALVLDLEHGPLVRPVAQVQRLGDHPVQARPLVLLEPPPGHLDVRRRRRHVHRGRDPLQGPGQQGPAVALRHVHQRVVAQRQHVEGDERGRGALGQRPHPRVRRVDPLGQRVEVQPLIARDHDLPVQHAPLGHPLPQRRHDLGKVPGQRLAGAAAQLHLVPVAEDDRPEAVPLRLVLHARRDLRHGPGEHRLHGRHHGKIHGSDSAGIRPPPPGVRGVPAASSVARMAQAVELDVAGRTVRISSPDKIFFPERGYTKLDVARYYQAVAPGLLRALRERPTTLQRYPDGITGEWFYQKRAPKGMPDWIPTAHITFPSGRSADEMCPTEERAVVWAAQYGTRTFHPWPVRRDDVDHPEELRLDLDPQPGTDYDYAVRAAHELRAVLDEYGLRGWPKTSGGRGLHVFVPIEPRWTFTQVRRAAIAVGREMERRMPEQVTIKWWKEERGERIFVDYNQTARDRTIASAYSVRPRPHAPVSAPLRWEEVGPAHPQDFDLVTMPARF